MLTLSCPGLTGVPGYPPLAQLPNQWALCPVSWTIHQGIEMGRPSELFVTTMMENGTVRFGGVAGASVLIGSGSLHV